jgi:hypothetical protein
MSQDQRLRRRKGRCEVHRGEDFRPAPKHDHSLGRLNIHFLFASVAPDSGKLGAYRLSLQIVASSSVSAAMGSLLARHRASFEVTGTSRLA